MRHHDHCHPHRRHGRIQYWVKHRLHRRIFIWLATTILITSVVVAISMLALSFGSGGPHDDWAKGERFIGRRFAEVWDDPVRRDELAKKVSAELEIGVRLEDLHGATFASFGPEDCANRAWVIPIGEPDRIGTASFCSPHNGRGLLHVLTVLGVTTLGLWIASSFVARRIARPMFRLAKVTERIGKGELSVRMELERSEPDELGLLARSVNDMAERIERQLTSQKELLAIVSHELRTPLGHLRIIAELLRTATPEQSQKLLADLEAEILEVDRLVGEVLDQGRLDFLIVDARDLSAKELAVRALERKGRPADLVLGEDARVRGDATLLSRALTNLIDNAEKHGGGLVRLAIEPTATEVVIAAIDAGKGLDETRGLFEPFQRSNALGLGLGLSLVRRIAEAHGGSAFAENRPEGGAKIGVRIPRPV